MSALRFTVLWLVAGLLSAPCMLLARDSTTTETSILRVIDLDDDGVGDTVDVLTIWNLVRRGARVDTVRRVFASRMIQTIRWGDDTPSTVDDLDTTRFNLPLDGRYKTAIRFYDYNRDDVTDIVVSWNWEGDSSRNGHRMMVFTGGDALREETDISLGAVTGTRPQKTCVVEVPIDTSRHQPVGVGGYYFRKRPISAARPKSPAPDQAGPDTVVGEITVHASPNPVGEHVRVSISNSPSPLLDASLLSADGRSVLGSSVVEGGSILLRTEGVASGTYLLVITTETGDRASVRVVVQH